MTTISGLAALLSLVHGVSHADSVETDYTQYCSVCHGDKGDGRSHASRGLRPPPRDFTSPEAARLLTREYIIEVITHGKPGTAMTPWNSQLSSTQIESLANYIRTEFIRDRSSASHTAVSGHTVKDGKSIYDSTCSVCHGDDGEGALWGRTSLNPPPVNFTIADPLNVLTRDRMIASVTHGRSGTAMTAFASQLSPADVAAVVDYIREKFMQEKVQDKSAFPAPAATASTVGMAVLHGMPAERSAPADEISATGPDAPLPLSLNGNTATGMALYMSNCTACHGTEGNGDGPRAYFIFPRPRNFLLAENRTRFNRPVLFNAISRGVPGREMPAWSKVMTDQQIADITEYVFQAFVTDGPEGDMPTAAGY